DFVVVGCQVFVTERPVVAHAVMRANLEVHRSHAQRDASPVVRAAADDAGTKPAEVRTRSGNVRFAFDLPCTVGGAEFIFLAADTNAAMGQVVRPDVFLIVSFGNDWWPGLEQHHIQTALGEDLGCRTSGRPGADNANVVGFGRALDLHESPWSRFLEGAAKPRHSLDA